MKPSPCPLASAGLKITWNSFATTCLAKQENISQYNLSCKNCKIGKAVQAGRKVKPPAGIEIIEPSGWTPQPIRQPGEEGLPPGFNWPRGRKAIYPFNKMEVGKTYEGKTEDIYQIKAAARAIGRNHGKKFSFQVENNKFLVQRIE